MAAVLTVSLLGPVSVAVDGAPVALRAKEAAVIATLALRPGMAVLTEELADAVWGGREDDPRAAVQVQVSRLRRALGLAASLLATVAGGYRLDVEPVSVDAGGFEAHASRARAALQAGRHREAFQAADAALGRWRGHALGGMAEGWAAAEARRLEEGRLLAQEDRTEALAVLDPARAARDLEPLAAAEPLRERRWALLAGSLAASGRQGDALRALARARAVLRDALGVDPGPELADLERRLLDQDPKVLVSSRWQATRRGSLPAPVSSFVGRQDELEDLVAACATARLVTLTGTGGTGKTRLVLALADRLWAERPGGVWMVELDRLTDAEAVPAAVAATAAAEFEGSEPLVRAAASLGKQPALLILDSCEHVLDGAATTATALLAACPELLIVATSREPLGVTGEVTWVVPPLTLDGHPSDAVALLLERATAADPRIDAARWRAEFEVVARAVDGLPLAIELAAARLRGIDPGELATGLSQQLGVLVGRARGGPARHATMRAALDWGAALCQPTELAVLARCSVFRGGFTRQAAITVAGACGPPVGEDDVAAALEALTARSLLSRSAGRYRLLEPVRQWAAERLVSEGAAAAEAHGAWAVQLADTIGRRASRSPEPDDASILVAEHANLVAAVNNSLADGSDRALRIVGSLGHSWASAGWRDALSWAVSALKADPGVEPRIRARTLTAAAELAGVVPDPSTAVRFLREAVELAGTGAGRRQQGWALFELGKALMLSTAAEGGGATESVGCFREALAAFEESGDEFGRAWSMANLGYLALGEEDDQAAAGWMDKAHDVAVAGPFPHVLAIVHRERGVLASRGGDQPTALREAAAAIDSYRSQGDHWQLVNALAIGAEVSWHAGRFLEAISRLDEALAGAAVAGFGDTVMVTAIWVAQLALDAGLEDDARRLGQLVAAPLERRSRLWPVTAAALRAWRASFPDLRAVDPPPPSEIASEVRSVLEALTDVVGPNVEQLA